MSQEHVRNFCIIAHIDHGKSTLADRLIELTGAVSKRNMTAQHLDTMDLEQERGITIKAQAVRLQYNAEDGTEFQLNLIDTPGHVDFAYEVSRSLAACEGAVLLVDATQGIQAQTIANVYLALEHDLEIIPVINKLDMPAAQPERVLTELEKTFGFDEEEVLKISAKTGDGVAELIDQIVNRVEPPMGEVDEPLRALIFDSKYDQFKGVVAYVRAMHGTLKNTDRVRLMGTGIETEVLETGYFSPVLEKTSGLQTGEVGYVATGLKDVKAVRVGDTMTLSGDPAFEPLPGYVAQSPMVFTGLFPTEGEDYPELRDALEKLQLNDAALVFEPESSAALGFGYRCGFLGLLHMDIVQERLEREYDLGLIATAPSVSYEVLLKDGEIITVDNPSKLPENNAYDSILEPWVNITIVSPARYIGTIMELVTSKRGEYKKMEYLESIAAEEADANSAAARDARVLLEYDIPLSEILVDFHDKLKSGTQGYGSMDYSMIENRPADLVKLDVLVNHEPVDALSMITHREEAAPQGRALTSKLKELIPRQMYAVPIQAAIGGKIVARTNVKALRKNVLAKCYGGDVTRKRKLLEQQKKGKKRRMKMVGSIEVPQEAFMAVLSLD
ncbi:MAG: translation elongation factor 4 [Dehalococcoidia bacterium]|jgi:GTP-binding protein LepA|nr:elongation factor 4 [Chloroflexota bacterium]MDP6056568.1 translation elongation factor 4 [Dehalococcoidia bacterium]MDP7089884.1 translation elongation factor 4 [Dehalococcoidia bacterium]MDP7485195.1 translation elongation factor 4 [Dehalococcoidia bacterium]|tara:strand:- start:5941 stop:7785 length:1845 start_codon:yes stop_codon:yes gene_type:complete